MIQVADQMIKMTDQMIIDLAEFNTFRLKPDNKTPATKNGFYDAKENNCIDHFITDSEIFNIGIRTGGGLLVLDIDVHKNNENGYHSLEELSKEIGIDLKNQNTFKVKTPSGGMHIYFHYDPSDGEIRSMMGVRKGIDIKASGGYVVAPPSIIKNKFYQVLENKKISDSDIIINQIKEICNLKQNNHAGTLLPAEAKTLTLPEVKHYLQYMCPDCNREEWIKIAFAMHSMCIDGIFHLFDSWSSQSEKYNQKETLKLWRSIKGGNVSYKSFFDLAINKYNAKPFHHSPNGEFDFIDKPKEDDNNELVQIKHQPPRSLPKEIDYWPDFALIVKDIYNTAPYKYRDASILTAFHLLSSVLATKVPKDVRLNLFSTLIMPTASGKDHYTKRFQNYRNRLDIERNELEGENCEKHCITHAASIQGYQRILKDLPHRTIVHEEIFPSFLGRALLEGKDAIQEQIHGNLLRLFNSSTLMAISNKKVEDSTLGVNGVTLSIFGTGVPEDAHKIFSSRMVTAQGSTNRFIKIYEPTLHIDAYDLDDETEFNPPLDENIYRLLERYFDLDEVPPIVIRKTKEAIRLENESRLRVRSIDNEAKRAIKARNPELGLRLASLIALTEAVRNEHQTAKITAKMLSFCLRFLDKSEGHIHDGIDEEECSLDDLINIINPKRKKILGKRSFDVYACKTKSIHNMRGKEIFEKLLKAGKVAFDGKNIKFLD